MTKLGVNIDHVATLRQARQEKFPDPVNAAIAAVRAGADGITAHLREDRRHIQDADIRRLKKELTAPLNLEMGAVDGILEIAEDVKPLWACFVPERRTELTTEGGLDVFSKPDKIREAIDRLGNVGTRVSLFVEGRIDVMRQAKSLGAAAVEIHTGAYASAFEKAVSGGAFERAALASVLDTISAAAEEGARLGLLVNAGHGLTYENTPTLLKRFAFNELNIGFAIIARAVFVGIMEAVREMKNAMEKN